MENVILKHVKRLALQLLRVVENTSADQHYHTSPDQHERFIWPSKYEIPEGDWLSVVAAALANLQGK